MACASSLHLFLSFKNQCGFLHFKLTKLSTRTSRITGTFKNGEAEGKEILVEYPGGSWYKGDILAGLAHGEGIFAGKFVFC